MAIIGWIVTTAFLILAGLFVASNLEPVSLTLWPLQRSFDLPLFYIALAPLILGGLVGMLFGWSSAASARRHAREERRRAQQLQRQLAAAQRAGETPQQPRVPAALPPAMHESEDSAQLTGATR